jgi:hypothetical protein
VADLQVSGAAPLARLTGCPIQNWFRITQILRRLILLGLETEVRAWYRHWDDSHRRRRFPIGDDTFQYWSNAVCA